MLKKGWFAQDSIEKTTPYLSVITTYLSKVSRETSLN